MLGSKTLFVVGAPSGQDEGTVGAGFLISTLDNQNILITALHNVGTTTEFTVNWNPDIAIGYATGQLINKIVISPLDLLAYDGWEDWAAFKIHHPPQSGIQTLIPSTTTIVGPTAWTSHGWPDPTSRPDGQAITGITEGITHLRRSFMGQSVRVEHIQLMAPALAASLRRAAKGYSGGPVIIDDQVVGMIRARDVPKHRSGEDDGQPKDSSSASEPGSVGGTLYAIPIHVIIEKIEKKTSARFHRTGTDGRLKEISDLEQKIAELGSAGETSSQLTRQVIDLKRTLRDGPQLFEGEVLGERYEIKSGIGSGGFATVWKTYDRLRKAHIALKCIHGQWVNDRDRRERFEVGTRRMNEIDHPAIARILDMPQTIRGFCFYTMPWYQNGDLESALRNDLIDRTDALRGIRGILAGLEHAHSKGIIHRDIKPTNILIDKNKDAVLSDFDLARALNSTRGTRTGAMGTFTYAAPEQLNDASRVDEKSDIYSIAMTLLFVLTGEDPPVLVARTEPDYVSRIACGSGLRSMLGRAVAYDPKRRNVTCAQLRMMIDIELAARHLHTSFEVREESPQVETAAHSPTVENTQDAVRRRLPRKIRLGISSLAVLIVCFFCANRWHREKGVAAPLRYIPAHALSVSEVYLDNIDEWPKPAAIKMKMAYEKNVPLAFESCGVTFDYLDNLTIAWSPGGNYEAIFIEGKDIGTTEMASCFSLFSHEDDAERVYWPVSFIPIDEGMVYLLSANMIAWAPGGAASQLNDITTMDPKSSKAMDRDYNERRGRMSNLHTKKVIFSDHVIRKDSWMYEKYGGRVENISAQISKHYIGGDVTASALLQCRTSGDAHYVHDKIMSDFNAAQDIPRLLFHLMRGGKFTVDGNFVVITKEMVARDGFDWLGQLGLE